jgi:cytidine deaminase
LARQRCRCGRSPLGGRGRDHWGFPLELQLGDDLCAETGPIYAAYTTGQTIVAAVCVSRDVSSGQVTLLAPCGACQERLALWGSDVEVGVADPMSATGWSSKRLLELNPFYWAAAHT